MPYPRYVPVFVLNYANQIKRECPGAEFAVHELYRELAPQPDPFLLVRHGSEQYYVAVWDEKDYERRA